MQRVFLGLLTALAVVMSPQYLAAQDGKRPDGPRPEMKGHWPGPRPEAGQPWQHGAKPPRRGPATPRQPMAKAGGPQASMPNARAIFDALDTNHDGKLSFEEFCVGLRHLRQALATRAQAWSAPFQRGVFAQAPKGMPGFGQQPGNRFFLFTQKPQLPHPQGAVRSL